METKGHNGQIHFDGQWVTISRRGFLGRSTVGKGDKRIHLGSIAAVNWKPAGPITNGFIQFAVTGSMPQRSTFGNRTSRNARDENTVLFTWQQRQQFEALRAQIENAIAASRAGAVPSPAPQPAAADSQARLRQLQGLVQEGLISPQEYETKRAEVLRNL